eukprot:CAMPEP_0202971190 /NCGR_PEP_ID=MMETSP1396-20130829/24822_1 /ASSEMBLY_ACC=CAM_ASM_000872 /TAXON_ID= /ORGANISM="Pseudokeronopsis sp., Strain Brazil" /LENGTH=91 /DNA_ID=CAMNT_0049700329 /DNA_START=190 /DNA_END=462 /DNA_ORIENTATION=-
MYKFGLEALAEDGSGAEVDIDTVDVQVLDLANSYTLEIDTTGMLVYLNGDMVFESATYDQDSSGFKFIDMLQDVPQIVEVHMAVWISSENF